MEEWRDVPNYEGIYKVSSMGNIKSLITNKILKPSFDRFGYARFSATKKKSFSAINEVRELYRKKDFEAAKKLQEKIDKFYYG